MTLVTVEFTEKDISISADTLLTTPKRLGLERDGMEKSKIPGGLKLFILNDNCCLCFAGAYTVGLTLLRKVFSECIQNDLELLKDTIRREHHTSLANEHTATDFLLCLRKERKCLIWRQGGYLETTNNCFIGNSDAYRSIDKHSNDRRHLSDLVSHPGFPTIGGLVLSVSDNNRFFYYSYTVSFYAQKAEIADESFGYQWVTIAVNYPTPRLGVYFFGGNFGCLYDPLILDDALTIEAESIELFKEKAKLVNACHVNINSSVIATNTSSGLSFHDPFKEA